MSNRALVKKALMSDGLASRTALAGYRALVATRYVFQIFSRIPSWLIESREITNFTYDLTERNLVHLAELVSVVTGVAPSQIGSYLKEPGEDEELLKHLQSATSLSPRRAISDLRPKFGRRLGWYAFVRALKPKIVIETGVDKGLGSVLLCAALLRNREEGFPGYYYGTDINRDAGFLLSGKWAEVGKILFGDSIESLRQIGDSIDVFINDSDHSAQYEFDEYNTVLPNLAPAAIVLGDNSHVSQSLPVFARNTGRNFLFFAEEPSNHWYPGGGIGVCFGKRPQYP